MPRQSSDDAFRVWLQHNTDLSPRVVGDTVSRLRRVRGMIDLSDVDSRNDLTIRLLGNETFLSCSSSVKAQLKRAALYYLDFSAKNVVHQ